MEGGIGAIEIALVERYRAVVIGGEDWLLFSGGAFGNILRALFEPLAEGLRVFLCLSFSLLGGGDFCGGHVAPVQDGARARWGRVGLPFGVGEFSAVQVAIGDSVFIRVESGLQNAELAPGERRDVVGASGADKDVVFEEGTAGFNVADGGQEDNCYECGNGEEAGSHGSLRARSVGGLLRQP